MHQDRSDLYVYKCLFFYDIQMLPVGRLREETFDETPVKRARIGPTIIQSSSSSKMEKNSPAGAGSKLDVRINVQTTVSSSSQPALSEARIQQKANLIAMRFRKAIRRNDSTTMKVCLESGYKPSVQEWLQIIGKMHVNTALNCVSLARTLQTPCISAAIKRQHKQLFKEVISRVESVPITQMESLMAVPAYYLEICLNRGLDPNVKLKNKRLPLEHACAHSRIGHVEILLKDSRTSVSQNVCRFMIRQSKQQKFADKAIELCDDIVPNMILEAIIANVTTALCSIMDKLESKFEHNRKWEEVTHMLRCPISQDYSADLVKTPLNDHYYDRVQLLTWVRSKGTDPQTREPLQESDLLLRSEFLKEYALVLQKKIKDLDS